MIGSEIYNLNVYNYDIPHKQIAQHPSDERDRSRLLVINQEGHIEHRVFTDILGYLKPGDILVLNNTRVIPARLNALKEGTGGKVEVLLIKDIGDDNWEVMVNKRLRSCQMISIGNGALTGQCININGRKVVKFNGGEVRKRLMEYGLPPLPPYIKRNGSDNGDSSLLDMERYQTVYAENEGSLAAPTAGLHFTDELLKKLRGLGIRTVNLTLHIGTGTFVPVKEEDLRHHRMEREFYHIPDETSEVINRAKAEGRRVVAVGTTTTRALESASDLDGRIIPGSGYTEIFIYHGYRFRVVDALITNFHQPRSTLLMLVIAFAGRDTIMTVYTEAIDREYRFYSYGDSMLILRRRDV